MSIRYWLFRATLINTHHLSYVLEYSYMINIWVIMMTQLIELLPKSIGH